MIEVIVKTKEFKDIFVKLIDSFISELLEINNSIITNKINLKIENYENKDNLIEKIYSTFSRWFYTLLIEAFSQYYFVQKNGDKKENLIHILAFSFSISTINISHLHKIFEYDDKVPIINILQFVKLEKKHEKIVSKYLSLFVYHIYEIRMKFIKDNFKKHLIPDLVNLIDLYIINC
jgi:hypothetical protein